MAEFVQNQCEPLVQEAVDATIHRENGTFVITPSQTGLTVDQNATIKTLNEALAQGLEEPVMIDAAVTVSEPKVTEEMLGTIQDVLGTCSTSFSSSGAARSKNLKVGSGKINGTVLLPGETLHLHWKMAMLQQGPMKMDGWWTALAAVSARLRPHCMMRPCMQSWRSPRGRTIP